MTARLNNALRRLGTGWALFVEADRRQAAPYPASTFPDALSWLVDQERRAAFDEVGELFESAYHLTLVYLPAPEGRARAGALMLDAPDRLAVDWREQMSAFVEASDRVSALLDGFLPELAWLDDAETLTYLHGTVSTRRHAVAVPETPAYLDALLVDEPLTGGLEPMLGQAHLRVLTVRGFPPRLGLGCSTISTGSASHTAGARGSCSSTRRTARRNWRACAASGSPSARGSSRCSARRCSSRRARSLTAMPPTRRWTPTRRCKPWVPTRSRSAI